MKTLREYWTSKTELFCDVTFIPEFKEDPEANEDEIFPALSGSLNHCNLRLSALVSYPEDVVSETVSTRLEVLSHPNVNLPLVIAEVQHFLIVLQKMYDL